MAMTNQTVNTLSTSVLNLMTTIVCAVYSEPVFRSCREQGLAQQVVEFREYHVNEFVINDRV